MNLSRIDSEGGEHVPYRREIPHYHGDSLRVLFVVAAILLIIAQSTGADLPLSVRGTITTAIVLVVAAGITNPAQGWIHWFNALLAVSGTLRFGMTAIERYRTGVSLADPSFLYIEVLSILSLVALYLTTKTIRGFHQRPQGSH
jgi:hypothetical protein